MGGFVRFVVHMLATIFKVALVGVFVIVGAVYLIRTGLRSDQTGPGAARERPDPGPPRLDEPEATAAARAPASPPATSAVRVVEPPALTPAAPEPPAAPPEPVTTPKPVVSDIDDATRALFENGSFFRYPDAPGKPITCGGRIEKAWWVRLSKASPSYLEQQDLSTGRVLGNLLTFGLASFAGPGNLTRTIHLGRTEGRYVTLVVGRELFSSVTERGAPERRRVYYRLGGNRFGLVEDAPADAPPAPRPAGAKRPPVKAVHLLCTYDQTVRDARLPAIAP
jgi:hypothetical protein